MKKHESVVGDGKSVVGDGGSKKEQIVCYAMSIVITSTKREMYIMKKETVREYVGKCILSIAEKYAVEKADSLCMGRMYEPIVPEKLKKRRELS